MPAYRRAEFDHVSVYTAGVRSQRNERRQLTLQPQLSVKGEL